MSPTEKYADKIAKLIAKAEGTDNPIEAETFFAKAQELMTQWGITEALLDKARGVERDEIEQREFLHTGYYAGDKGNLSWIVIRTNGARGVYMKSGQYSLPVTVNGKAFSMWYRITATGFKSDLERIEMLETSLQLQMARALAQEWKKEDRSWMSKTQNVRWRQSFMEGFAAGVGTKFVEATKAGREAAARDASLRDNISQAEADTSVALVVRSRKDRIDEWMDQKYGQLRAGRGSSRRIDHGAYGSGTTAGRSADVGQPGLKGKRGIER